MRAMTEYFQINGAPMLVPDAEVAMSFEDLDAADAGRDESGFMHRIMMRHKVGSWNFTYGHLTEEERQYMENLFPETDTFLFRHPSVRDAEAAEETVCYRSKYGISWRNARTGLWSNYSFTIIEC